MLIFLRSNDSPVLFVIHFCFFLSSSLRFPAIVSQRLLYDTVSMSSTLDPVTGDSLERTSNENSLRARQRQTQFDGVDDMVTNDSNDSHHGFSRNDRSDMHRMGRVQELRVST